MERRERILRAAAAVAGEKGFQAAGMRDIAAAAGVAIGTLYIYFKKKRDILAAFLEQIRQDRKEVDRTLAGLRPWEALEIFVEKSWRCLREKAPYGKVVTAEALFDKELAQMLNREVTRPMRGILKRLLEACGATNGRQAAALGWDMIWFGSLASLVTGHDVKVAELVSAIAAIAGCRSRGRVRK
jgi:AcrR family transcriptional regulator